MTTISQLSSWTLHEPPVATGPVEPGLWTLDDLSRREGVGLLGDTFGSSAHARRAQSLLALQWAVLATVEVVVAPLAHDGIEIAADPTQVGLVVDDRLGVTALWIGAVESAPGDPQPERLGRTVAALLSPVLESALVDLGRDDAEHLLVDELTVGVRALERATCDLVDTGWADRLLAGARALTSIDATTSDARSAA